ncbi:hypothetical protein ACFLR3_00850 [Campylobacterota bacterium]
MIIKLDDLDYAVIDTFCFSVKVDLFSDLPDGFALVPIKDIGKKPTKEEKNSVTAVTGRSYQKKYRRRFRLFLIYDQYGQCYIASQRTKCDGITIEFHGLYQYGNDGQIHEDSIRRRHSLNCLLSYFQRVRIKRVDYAMDSPKTSVKILDRIRQKRVEKQVGSTLYFQPPNQRESENPRLKITWYDKSKKDNLPFQIQRLEFSLKTACWSKNIINIFEIETMILKKGRDTLERWIGCSVEVGTYKETHGRVNTTKSVGVRLAV